MLNPEDTAIIEILQNIHWTNPAEKNPPERIRQIIRKANAQHYLPLLKKIRGGDREALNAEIARLEYHGTRRSADGRGLCRREEPCAGPHCSDCKYLMEKR